jgi:hypothetical protein
MPQIQVSPRLEVVVPDPEQSSVFLVPGIADSALTRQAGTIVDQSMDGLDRRKISLGHHSLLRWWQKRTVITGF